MEGRFNIAYSCGEATRRTSHARAVRNSCFESTCDSKYIAVALLERTVLEQVIKVLADPERILAEAIHVSEQGGR